MIRFLFFGLVLNCFIFGFDVVRPKVYKNQKIDGWLMSEKLDGIRGYWDGKNLYTKNQKPLYPPKQFLENFPPFALDGELWSKRNDFEFIQNTVLDKTASSDWDKITFNIFEVPNQEGNLTQRQEIAKKWFAKYPSQYARLIPYTVCKNKKHLEQFLDELIANGAEGVVIVDPKVFYSVGRSDRILKYKKFYDMEGVVVKINYDQKNQFKSLRLRLPNNAEFNLANGFEVKKSLTKIGDIVSFKYYGLTHKQIPKFSSFIRIRQEE